MAGCRKIRKDIVAMETSNITCISTRKIMLNEESDVSGFLVPAKHHRFGGLISTSGNKNLIQP
jgi:hypothetical protein